MGWCYSIFRICYQIQCKTGLLKLRFAVNPKPKTFISLEEWRNLPLQFFFDPANFEMPRDKTLVHLREHVANISQNRFRYFYGEWLTAKDWHTNPKTGFTYSRETHWSQIQDFADGAGDIKYVWEKSRFCFLYDIIRCDFHFEKDQSTLVFNLIESWIDENPVNRGPNWKCGQEISLRALNWLFALHYYRFSNSLNQLRFDKIINSIYQQMRRVEENISFALIAVRNNHALTETAGLYLAGLLLPFFPESKKWKQKGKTAFEKEIVYQIYEDGTFLQFSMNYHRVAVQLLTWVLTLAKLNGDFFDRIVYKRAEKSLFFLLSCQDKETGMLPHYGHSDGALFFPLTACHFRDFRPQLTALATALAMALPYGTGCWNEEADWLTNRISCQKARPIQVEATGRYNFPKGGYYVLRDDPTITFLRCGFYSNRPFQSDNLHLDIWVNGENILRDAGSCLYNANETIISYFSGTASHNTVMLGKYDQMTRLSRFAWTDWIKIAGGHTRVESKFLSIEAAFQGYKAIGPGITHSRKVVKLRGQLHWVVEDFVENVPSQIEMHQIWHPSPSFSDHFEIKAFGESKNEIMVTETQGWFSETYGAKVESRRLVFSTFGRYIKTIIRMKI
ncbi:alginate lyase family protein [Dyadobacter sp. CY323]|uniref:heparinase II/III family protein n=1 Tax=Dyadobacter sp. CY323 TaxID=2907302 RepID=UPI001F1CBD0E|nr:alginate lyase family protein [Dyadobacter sp. CY323]MCE6988976.1 heparinase II/III family protein [Dyadobacter sp. CY323]